MKYTKNIQNKLILKGFQFKFKHKDDEIHYDVHANGGIEATIDHTNKEVLFHLNVDDEKLNINSFAQLEKLTRTLNQVL